MTLSEHEPLVALRFDLDFNDGNECQDTDVHHPTKKNIQHNNNNKTNTTEGDTCYDLDCF